MTTTSNADDDATITIFSQAMARAVRGLRTGGFSDAQVMSLLRTVTDNFIVDTIERIEKRKGRKLSGEEIDEITEKAKSAFEPPLEDEM